MEETLLKITNYVDKDLVYSTPYSATWKSYCDAMVHSLVIVDTKEDQALLVYSYNQLTKNISGQIVKNWRKENRMLWTLTKLTLNSNLPVDIVEVHSLSLQISKPDPNTKKKDIPLEIRGDRYFKVDPDGKAESSTRIVANGGIYCSHDATPEECSRL